MKMLYVIRHAKSSWSEPGMRDFDRPLNDRGLRDAPAMAARLKEKGVRPDLIVSSPAKRAMTTAKIFAAALGYDENAIVYKDMIYEASTPTLLGIVKGIDSDANNVLIFGHNPTFTYFVNDLAAVRIDDIPTCGVAAIAIEGEWKEINDGAGNLVWFDYPKNV
jgi:phosphohistidine phosphatase